MAQMPITQNSPFVQNTPFPIQRAATLLTIIAVIIGGARYFPFALQQDWWQLLLFYGAFILGSLLAPMIFIGEQVWLPRFISLLNLDSKASYSALRNSILFLVLPILGLFLVSSSRAPIGLGFLLSISLWYAWEAVELLRGNRPLFQQYFGNRYQVLTELHQYLLYFYLGYAIFLAIGLVLI